MGKIVVIGSSNTDLTVRSSRIPAAGETLIGGDCLVAGGGKGANQAIAVARLGGELEFVAKVGDDVFGHGAIEAFKRDGIDVSNVFVDPKAPSGVALICVDDRAENAIVVAPGANMTLTCEEIDSIADDIRAADYLLMQLESPIEVVCHAADIAHRAGCRVILNPAPAAVIPQDLYGKLYLITPNETECATLTGMNVDSEAEVEAAARLLRSRGVGNVVVTLGTRGALCVTDEGTRIIPAYKVHAVDTVAAGDTFSGALAVALSEGRTICEAADFAARASAIAVTRPGAQLSVPTRREVDDFDVENYR